ncbi:hypothetical protein EPUL_005012 [Erysiphe pulchra]|uniref:Uncharacterized protein n=1 Tax=Erysiphe pulchra TaxID=225359 RepID=A0A2S4PMD4_9PEZI|nr:hypothetical protein EPUL_005012 [Erysiphe pulchra]
MRIVAIFLILNIQLGHIFATNPNPLVFPTQTNHDPEGYECGNFFFTDPEINEALLIAKASVDKGYKYPQIYQGKLYRDAKIKQYFLWPIRKGSQIPPKNKVHMTTFRVVFTRDSDKVVDVIAKVTTDDYVKCIRRGSSHIEPSHSEPVIPNGYLCGHKFFTDEILRQSHTIALNSVHGKTKRPFPYIGQLYPKDSGHLMWPITRTNKIQESGKVHITTYYLILKNEGDFVDVVIRGYSNNFLRCIRSRQPPKAPESDPHSKLFVPPPKSGFLCGKTFFDDKVLEESVKTQAGNENRGQYPIEYSGHPYYVQCLIWPLMKDGSLYKKGMKGPYRLVLKPDYKVMSVAIWAEGKLIACDRKTMKGKKEHDTSDYHCFKQRFTHEKLVKAAEEACAKLNEAVKNFYPAKYEGPEYKLKGPYYTYPVFLKGSFIHRNVGLARVVINTNCEVVGALTTLKLLHDKSLKRLVRCHRIEDGPLPAGFFGANAVTVLESRISF